MNKIILDIGYHSWTIGADLCRSRAKGVCDRTGAVVARVTFAVGFKHALKTVAAGCAWSAVSDAARACGRSERSHWTVQLLYSG